MASTKNLSLILCTLVLGTSCFGNSELCAQASTGSINGLTVTATQFRGTLKFDSTATVTQNNTLDGFILEMSITGINTPHPQFGQWDKDVLPADVMPIPNTDTLEVSTHTGTLLAGKRYQVEVELTKSTYNGTPGDFTYTLMESKFYELLYKPDGSWILTEILD